MTETLKKIEDLINKDQFEVEEVKQLQIQFIKNELKAQHCVDKYIGDFPTFLEPVHLGDNVEIGDDALIGPNVFLGNNCKIGDYCELINTIIFDDVKIGENMKLENAIIASKSSITISNLKESYCIMKGNASKLEELKIIRF